MPREQDLNILGATLHARLLSGDETASSIIAEAFLPKLAEGLSRKYYNLPDPSVIQTACVDALMAYLRTPQKFDSGRGKLLSYLWISAEGDLLNLLEQHRRRNLSEIQQKVVELTPSGREVQVEPSVPPEVETEMINRESRMVRLATSLLSDEKDRQVLDLMMDGIRETAEFAKVLEVSQLPEDQQVAIVKRNKDRIKKAVQRGLRVLDGKVQK